MTAKAEGNVSARGAHFSPARRTRSFEDVVDQIRDAVAEGRLKHGERLPNERTLCQTFAISRSTLREALRTLEALGMVTIKAGAAGGIFIAEPSGAQVGQALEALIRFRSATPRDLAEFRVSFEGETAFWAAERAMTEDLAELDGIVSRFRDVASDAETRWSRLAEIDVDFHNAMARASKNQIREAIMLGIYRALYKASLAIAPVADLAMRRSIARELELIVDAVRKSDGPLARKRMVRHVQRFSDLELKLDESDSEKARADGRAE